MHYSNKISFLMLLLSGVSYLVAEYTPWPEGHCLVLKMNVKSEIKIFTIPCDLINEISDFWISEEFLHPTKVSWKKMRKMSKHKQMIVKREMVNDQHNIVHVCCSSILHGTCSHQATAHLPPAVFCEDGLLIEQEAAAELNIPVVNEEDFLQEQEINSLRNLSAYDTPVPEELLHFSNPSMLTVYLQKMGIAALLYAVQARQYMLAGWRYVKSCAGFDDHA